MHFFSSRDKFPAQKGDAPLPCSAEWFMKQSRPVYFFGAGRYGWIAAFNMDIYCPQAGIKGFLDSNPSRVRYQNLPVYDPEYPKRNNENPIIIVTAQYGYRTETEIIRLCQKFGYEYYTFRQFILPLSAQPWTREELEGNADAVRALDVWADVKSADIYRNLLKVRVTQNENDMPEMEHNQYFVPLIPKKMYRSFVDCGAYNGDLIDTYRKFMHHDFDNYYAVEADQRVLDQLRFNCGNDPRISIHPSPLSDSRKMVAFNDDDCVCGFIANDGVSKIQAETIDNLFSNKPVTMIKMDIEGSEIPALDGARKTISEQHPALVISMYHSAGTDMWRVPLWIHDLGEGYSLYCRHHSPALNETICYAFVEK